MNTALLKKAGFLAALAFVFLGAGQARAQNVAQAEVYQVTLKKLELCDSTSVILSDGTRPVCNNAYTIGQGDSTFDIASVSAGQALGSYTTITTLPAGHTYEWMKMTLSRRFEIKGNLTSIGCYTSSTNNSTAMDSLIAGVYYDTADNAETAAAEANKSTQTLMLASVNAYGGGMPSNTGAQGYWTNHLDIPDMNGDDFYFYVPISPALTAGGTIPNLKVEFDTNEGLSGEITVPGSACSVHPNFPSIHITPQ